MLLLDGPLRRPLLASGLLAIFMVCAGCHTATQSLFTVSGPGWHVQEGQAVWRPRWQRPSLGGDLVLATHQDGRSWLEFSKPALPMVSAQITRTNWLVQFPAADMGFTGRGKPPTRFVLLYLHAALSGESLPARVRFAREPDGSWRLENARTGELLEGYLSP